MEVLWKRLFVVMHKWEAVCGMAYFLIGRLARGTSKESFLWPRILLSSTALD